MSVEKTPPVVAIALDSFGSTLLRQLVEEGELPNLAAFLTDGRYAEVESTYWLGTAAVWPTFVS